MSELPSFKDMLAFHKTPKWNPGDPNVKQFVREVAEKDPKTAGENLAQIIDEHKTWNEGVPNSDKQHTLIFRRDEDLPMNQNGVNKPRETVTDVLPDGGYRYDYEFGNKLPTEREFEVTERGGTDIAPVGLNDRAADAKWTVENLKPFRDLVTKRTMETFGKTDSIAKRDEWDDQFELYLNMNPDKRKEIEDKASVLGPNGLKIARRNAMDAWIKENEPETGYFRDESGKGYYNPMTGYHEYTKLKTPSGMPKYKYMATGYNQGIVPGTGLFGINRGPPSKD